MADEPAKMVRVFCDDAPVSSEVPEDYLKPRGGAAVAAERIARMEAARQAATAEPESEDEDLVKGPDMDI